MSINPTRAEARYNATVADFKKLKEQLEKAIKGGQEAATKIANLLTQSEGLQILIDAMALDPAHDADQLVHEKETLGLVVLEMKKYRDDLADFKFSETEFNLAIAQVTETALSQAEALSRKIISYPVKLNRHLNRMRNSRNTDRANRTKKHVDAARQAAADLDASAEKDASADLAASLRGDAK